MDIQALLKDPKITKIARGVVCLFAFLSIIGAFITLFGSLRGGAGMSLAMAITTFVFSIAAAVLAYFSKNNFIFSVVGGIVSIIHFIMGLVISPLAGEYGELRFLVRPGGYTFATVIFIITSGLIIGVNALGIIMKSERAFIEGVRNMSQQPATPQTMMMNAAQQQTQQMMQTMQQMQQPMMGQPQMQQPFPQQQVQQGVYPQQPYPQQQVYPQQGQPVYPQQGQPVYPQQGQQQYQQPNNFNQQ